MNALPKPLQKDGERFLPDQTHGSIEIEHFHRYSFARQLVTNKIVLDIACGEGYGSAYLAGFAQRVVGVDIAPDAIDHATLKYSKNNLEYLTGSCLSIPLDDNAIDVVVSLETIEHISEHDVMMREIKRVLRPDGILVISSPDKLEYSDKPAFHNPFHVKELYREEISSLLAAYFQEVRFYGQRIIYGSALLSDSDPLSDIPASRYWVAVASDYTLPETAGGIFEQQDTSGSANTVLTSLIKAIADPESTLLKEQLTGSWYLQQNVDIAIKGVDPFKHWFSNGIAEGRLPASDPVDFAQRLIAERELPLRIAIAKKEKELEQTRYDSLKQQRTLEAEIHQTRLKAFHDIKAQLCQQVERERLFTEQLAQLQQSSNEEKASMNTHYLRLLSDLNEKLKRVQSKDITIKTVDELLALHAEAFVTGAYLVLLGRTPDPQGLSYYTDRLKREGNKMAIIYQIYRGAESRKFKPVLAGLKTAMRRYKWQKSRMPDALLDIWCRPSHTDQIFSELLLIKHKISEDSLIVTASNTLSECEIPGEITSDEFDAEWYLEVYQDVAKAGVDPYEHYINSGIKEKRQGVRKGSGYPQTIPVSDEQCMQLQLNVGLWPYKPLISIIMPTYNTSSVMLRQALDSVIQQLYPNWQLCIADDASSQPHVKSLIKEYTNRDARIKVIYRENNGGISAASNSALTLVTGDYTVLFDHDDLLERHALYHIAESVNEDYPDIIYSDELLVNEQGDKIIGHAFRPMFSLELLRSHPYIVHLIAFRTELLRTIGGFDESLTISQDYDLILRAVEHAQHIVHIPQVLYRWRTHETSSGYAQKELVLKNSKKILAAHLVRCGEMATVLDGKCFNFFEIRYPLDNNAKVAIIIPTKNNADLVRQCIESIEKTVSGIDYNIILVDHCSDDESSVAYFKEIHERHTILQYEGEFNFSRINNWAVQQLTGNYTHYLFCNNDIEALHSNWLHRMLELCQKPDIAIVGAKLYYPSSNTIQHAGVCVGMFGAAEHYGKYMEKELPDERGINPGYLGSLITNHEVSAVTAACMLIKRNAFDFVSGFDEHAKVGYGDVDLCLRVRQAGYRVLFCPYAELLHHESHSRGKSASDPHPEDSRYFINRWHRFIAMGDPYYNPNLTSYNTHWNLKRFEEFHSGQEKRRSFHKIHQYGRIASSSH